MGSYNLTDYVTVAERLAQAQSLVQMIVTEPPVMLTDTMGYIRATVGLSDGRSSTGTASFRLDLQGRSAQATNPIEDCETSAIGRALALLGFSSSKSIASREEVQEARRRADAPARPPAKAQNGASFGDVPTCPEHKLPMRPGKDGGWFCPTKHDGKWYSIKAAPVVGGDDEESLL
jgi:hypothetical protein